MTVETQNPGGEAVPRRLIPIDESGAHIVGGSRDSRPLSRSTIYRLIERGELQRVNIGKRAFVTADLIEAYLERLIGLAK